jgi:hypothetical protein
MTEQPDGNVYEMLWNCEFCGAEKLLGKTHRFCPSCGAAQNPDWRYFPSDEEKVAVHDHVYVGVDKICPACGTAQSASAEHCGRCGSPLEGAEQAKTHGAQSAAGGEHFQTEDLYARQDREQDEFLGRAEPAGEKKDRRVILTVILGVVVIAIIAALVAVFWKSEQSVTATGHRWEYEIDIEELQAVSESARGQCSSVAPADAYDEDTRWEQVDTKQVPDGEECRTVRRDNGDGTYREERVCETTYRSEPVYGDMCYYKVNRWRETRSVETQGGLDDPVVRPELGLRRTGNCVGCEREGDHHERYLLILTSDEGKEYQCPLDEPDWRAIPLDTAFTLKVGVVTGDADCGSLAPVE